MFMFTQNVFSIKKNFLILIFPGIIFAHDNAVCSNSNTLWFMTMSIDVKSYVNPR